MEVEVLNKAMEALKSDLGQGLIASDMWRKGTGETIVGYKSNANAVALFDQIITHIKKASEVSGFPQMEEFFTIRLKGNLHIVVVLIDDLEWQISVDGNKTSLGLLLNVVLPNVIETIKKA